MSSDEVVEQFGPLVGRKDEVRVTLTNLSYRQTNKGPRYPYGDFGSDFIDALHQALPTPRRPGLLRKPGCPACETSLDGIAVGPVTATTEVVLKRIPPISIEVGMPGITCPGCGRSVVMINDRDVASDLSDALIDAFSGVGFKP